MRVSACVCGQRLVTIEAAIDLFFLNYIFNQIQSNMIWFGVRIEPIMAPSFQWNHFIKFFLRGLK